MGFPASFGVSTKDLPNSVLLVFTKAGGGRPPRPEGRGFHAPGWLRCGPAGATSFPPRPEGRGFSEDLDELVEPTKLTLGQWLDTWLEVAIKPPNKRLRSYET